MDMNELMDAIQAIFRDNFDDDALVVTRATTAAVSYTHLDVYKRQVYTSFFRITLPR